MGFLCSSAEAALPTLIAQAQGGGDTGDRAIDEIARHFEAWIKSIGQRMASGRSYRDDVENAARYALVKAVLRHRGRPETFPAFAKRYMMGAALREAQRWGQSGPWSQCQIEAVNPKEWPNAPAADTIPDHLGFGDGSVGAAVRQLRPDQQRLLTQRYIEDLPLAAMGSMSTTSVAAVSQRLATAHRAIQKLLAA